MKKLILPFLLFSFFLSYGQNHYLGIKSGVSWTNTHEHQFRTDIDRKGFTIGVTYDYQFHKYFVFGAEFMYQQRGFSNIETFYSSYLNKLWIFNVNSSYDYLALPLKGGLILGNKISLVINFGIVPAYLIKGEHYAKPVDEPHIEDFSDIVSKFDLAGLVEAGVNIKITNRFLFTTLVSYQHSFTDTTDAGIFPESKLKHKGIILTGGIKYALKKD